MPKCVSEMSAQDMGLLPYRLFSHICRARKETQLIQCLDGCSTLFCLNGRFWDDQDWGTSWAPLAGRLLRQNCQSRRKDGTPTLAISQNQNLNDHSRICGTNTATWDECSFKLEEHDKHSKASHIENSHQKEKLDDMLWLWRCVAEEHQRCNFCRLQIWQTSFWGSECSLNVLTKFLFRRNRFPEVPSSQSKKLEWRNGTEFSKKTHYVEFWWPS